MRNNSRERLQFATKEECILVFLATGRKTVIGKDVQEAYKEWNQIPDTFKWERDMEMYKTLEHRHRDLYETLIKSFQIWDRTQDLAGAPGWCITDSSINDVVKHVGLELTSLLHAIRARKNPKRDATLLQVSRSPSKFNLPGPVGSVLKVDEQDLVTKSGAVKEDALGSEETADTRRGRNEELSVTDLTKLHGLLCSDSDEDELPKVGQECQDSEEKLSSTHLVDEGTAYKRLEDSLEQHNATTNLNMFLEEAVHLRNLQIDDNQDDSDLEKQISPLFSDEEV